MSFLRFKRYRRDADGTTTIEFGLLALPFVMTVLSIIELALFFATSMLLESAVQDGARMLRTGQIQQSAGNQLQEFLDSVCDRASALMDCDDIEYRVEKLDDFNDDITPVFDADGKMVLVFEASQITAGCVGMVRITYPFQFLTPVYGGIWSNYPNNTRLLVSTFVFETEPYNFVVTDPTCSI